MPLIECPDCGKRYSENAQACPECHCPTAVAKGGSEGGTLSPFGNAPQANLTVRGFQEGMLFGQERYELVSRLGRGGFGEVWKAKDNLASTESREVFVAVKLIPPDISRTPREIEGIKKNYGLVEGLVHQHIAALKGLIQDDEDTLLLMECVDGCDLVDYRKQYIEKHGSFPESEAIRIGMQIAQALDYAHSKKVLHRDIKPTNIRVTPSGDVKVLDFGLAAEIQSSMNRVSMAVTDTSGTRPYMSPEQWQGEPQGRASDQYALAVLLYEMLSGVLPFACDDVFVLQNCVLNQVPEQKEGIPDAVWAGLKRGLSKKPQDRYENCTKFIDDLRSPRYSTAQDSSASAVRQTSREQQNIPDAHAKEGSKPKSRTSIKVVLGISALFLLIIFVLVVPSKTVIDNNQLPKSLEITKPRVVEEESVRAQEAREQAVREQPAQEQAAREQASQEAHQIYSGFPFNEAEAKRRQQETAKALGLLVDLAVDLPNGVKMEFMLIPAGEFMMGSPEDEEDRKEEESLHRVRITKPFYMAKYECTQEQWQAITGENEPSNRIGGIRAIYMRDGVDVTIDGVGTADTAMDDDNARNPVTDVSWNAINDRFLPAIQKHAPKGMTFCLPTEAQWEYACRAGTSTRYHFGDNMTDQQCDEWWLAQLRPRPRPVGSYGSNAWGLHDMHGNVAELCRDWYALDFYSNSPTDDPENTKTGADRVLRGGGWYQSDRYWRSASRNYDYPYLMSNGDGFRLILEIK